jgi:hypothetical protein
MPPRFSLNTHLTLCVNAPLVEPYRHEVARTHLSLAVYSTVEVILMPGVKKTQSENEWNFYVLYPFLVLHLFKLQ